MNQIECLLKQIIIELKELNNRVYSRSNSNIIILHNTATTKTYEMSDIIGEHAKANNFIVLDAGGGLSISVNGDREFTTTANFSITNEDIHTLRLIGAAAGTAILRLDAYIPKYKDILK